MKMRFSLKTMLGGTLLAAIFIVSLARGTKFWAIVLLNLLLFVLLVTLLGALFRKGDARARCLGFFVGAASYLFLIRTSGSANALISSYLWRFLAERFDRLGNSSTETLGWGTIAYTPFPFIGHIFFALFLGLFGGWLAHYYHSNSDK